jgi:hypothetical protein
VLALVTVIFPLWSIRKVSQMTEQRGLFPVITNTCRYIGPKSAVVVLQEDRTVVYLSDPQTLRSFCNVPVTTLAKRADPQVLHTLADEWKKQGRTLYVVAGSADAIKRILPRARVHTTGRRTNHHLLELTLTRPPSRYFPEFLELSTAAVPDPAPSGSSGN